MRNSSLRIKLIIRASILALLFACFATRSNGQDPNFEVQINSIKASSSNSVDGQIIIAVKGDATKYTYVLFDKEPHNQGKAIAYSEKIDELSYTFKKLKAGNYFVCVVNSEDISRCKKITLLSE